MFYKYKFYHKIYYKINKEKWNVDNNKLHFYKDMRTSCSINFCLSLWVLKAINARPKQNWIIGIIHIALRRIFDVHKCKNNQIYKFPPKKHDFFFNPYQYVPN